MPKAIVVEDAQLAHAVAVARVSSKENGSRDAALLLCFFGTGMKPTELSQLLVSDYLSPGGEPLAETVVRAEIAFNGRTRPLCWMNPKLIKAVDEHLADRLQRGHGITGKLTAYRGLDPSSALFVSGRNGQPLKLSRVERGGRVSYRADQLTALISRLFARAGIDGATSQSGRRTLAVKLKRQGIDERYIGKILGMTSIKAIKTLCDTDPVRLGDLIRRVV
ncbi:TPA: site-specific integrase [Aeromonas salmonicida]|uniref:site-specific integrase n=1 Tax=Aeromonas salmonicida TaxID=645 RepID=UPI001F2B4DD1|nr:site-specific integrase [Aeromonas salmonicida]MCE9935648.1 site-specific integrase [Aeromonas salmonicida]HDO1191505.1 site-specific integrase [Aeromonas salmonicida]